MKISLKKALEMYGATNIEIHKGYQYRSGFFDKDGQLYYFSRDVDGSFMKPTTLTRTAQHRKDYTGGTNQYVLDSWLKDKGYEISIPMSKCDKNSQ